VTADGASELGYPTRFAVTIHGGGGGNNVTVDFGDGGTDHSAFLNEWNTTHQYAHDGVYDVTIVAVNPVSSLTKTVQVKLYTSQHICCKCVIAPATISHFLCCIWVTSTKHDRACHKQAR